MYREGHYEKNRVAMVVQIIIVVVFCGLRFAWLNFESLWFDEGFTLSLMRLGYRDIIRATAADTSPPLYYLLLKSWTNVFGTSEAGLRSFSAALSMLSLLLIWRIARKVVMHDWAVCGAMVLAGCSYLLNYHASEARFYSLVVFFAVGAIDRLLAFNEKPGILNALLAALCVGGGLWTHNTFGFYTIGIAGAALIMPSRTHTLPRILMLAGIFILAAAIYAPWVPKLAEQIRRINGTFWMPKPDNRELLLNTFARVVGVHPTSAAKALGWSADRGLIISAVACALAGIMIMGIVISSAVMMDEDRARRVGAIAFVTIIPAMLIVLYSLVRQSIFIDRAFVISAAMVPVICVVPISMTDVRAAQYAYGVGVGVLMFLVLVSATWVVRSEQKEPYRQATDYILQNARPRQGVIFASHLNQVLFDYYAPRSEHRQNASRLTLIPLPRGFMAGPIPSLQRLDENNPLGPLEEAVKQNQLATLVFLRIHSEQCDPKRALPEFFKQRTRLIDSTQMRTMNIDTYELNGTP